MKINIKCFAKITMVLLAICILIVSCSKPPLNSTTLPHTADTEIQQSPQVPTQILVIHTPTPQIQQNLPVPSNTASPTSTNTATLAPAATTVVPTLSFEQRNEFALSRLQQESECKLPCWWGTYPGQTSWNDVEADYRSSGILAENYKNTYVLQWRIQDKNKTIGYGITYILRSFSEPIVDVIFVGAQMSDEKSLIYSKELYELFPAFRINSVLSMYGEPGSVQIYTSGIGNEAGQISYGLVLDYSLSGIQIQYTGIASVQEDNLFLCPQNTSFDAFLWNPEKTDQNVLIQSRSNYFIPSEYVILYKELRQVTYLEIEDFYRIYSEPDSQKCLSTPLNYWVP